VNRTTTGAGMDDGRFAGRPNVSGPAVNALHSPSTGRHPGGDHPAGEWVDQAEQPPREPPAEVWPGT
jgi:hypothetical protein